MENQKLEEILSRWQGTPDGDQYGPDGRYGPTIAGLRLDEIGWLIEQFRDALEALPDSLGRPLAARIEILKKRERVEAELAARMRNKLQEVAGPEIASSIEPVDDYVDSITRVSRIRSEAKK